MFEWIGDGVVGLWAVLAAHEIGVPYVWSMSVNTVNTNIKYNKAYNCFMNLNVGIQLFIMQYRNSPIDLWCTATKLNKA